MMGILGGRKLNESDAIALALRTIHTTTRHGDATPMVEGSDGTLEVVASAQGLAPTDRPRRPRCMRDATAENKET